MAIDTFAPTLANTTAVSVSNTTANGALNLPTNGRSLTVRVHNATTGIVFIQLGGSTVTATTSHMPIPAGGVEVFALGTATYIAGIMSSGSGTLYATPGIGA